MERLPRILMMLCALLMPAAGFSAAAVPTDQDPVYAARAVKLAGKLRCLVCQNESIADSQAALAEDLRRQIRAQIAAGRSDNEIVDYMVRRYGDFVLYDPRFKPKTALLWLGPAIAFAAGIAALAFHFRRHRPLEAAAEKLERAAHLLAQTTSGEPQ